MTRRHAATRSLTPRARRRRLWQRTLILLALLVLTSPALIGIGFLAMSIVVGGGFYKIHSTSMEPTFYPGQSYLALPFDAEGDLVRGRIVTFLPPDGPDLKHTKRIVGLPGDRVAVVDGLPVINGQIAERVRGGEYQMASERTPGKPNYVCDLAGMGGVTTCTVAKWTEQLPGGAAFELIDAAATPQDNFPEMIVPKGHVFVLGDNRDNSIDSRFPDVGLIPVDAITGVAWRHFLVRGNAGIELGRFMERVR